MIVAGGLVHAPLTRVKMAACMYATFSVFTHRFKCDRWSKFAFDLAVGAFVAYMQLFEAEPRMALLSVAVLNALPLPWDLVACLVSLGASGLAWFPWVTGLALYLAGVNFNGDVAVRGHRYQFGFVIHNHFERR